MNALKKEKILNKTSLYSILIGLFVALAALAFIYMDALSIRSEQLPAMAPLPEITSQDVYRQKIVGTQDGLTKISVLCATYDRANSGTLSITLEDESGNTIQTWNTDVSSIDDNSYLTYQLNNKITDSNGRVFYLTITSDSLPGTAVTLYTSNFGGSKGLSSEDGDLDVSVCHTLEYELPASSLFNAKMVLITLLLLILMPVIIRIAVIFFPLKKAYLIVFPELAAILGCHRFLRHAVLGIFPPEFMASLFVAFCILWTLGAIVLYRLLYVKNISIQKLAVIVLSVFALFTIAFLTPGTGNDEQVHYAYAYKYANIFSFKGFSDPIDADGDHFIYMRDEDAELLSSITDVPVWLTEGGYKSTLQNFRLFSSDNSLKEHKTQPMLNFSTFTSNNVPLGYIASGLGIAIARLLHLGAIPTFYMGRVFNAALFIFLVYLSIKIIPVGKETLFVISMFPMVLQQTATYSYDSIIIGLLFLFTAMTMSVFLQDKKISVKQFVILALLSIGVAISKFVYAPLILILLAIPSDKLSVKKPNALKAAIIASLVLGGTIMMIVLQNTLGVLQYFTPSYAAGNSSILVTIVRYWEMIQMTAINISDFYFQSLVAYPGWYQIYVPFSIVCVYYLLLVFSLFRNDDNKYLSLSTKVWTAVLIFMSCVLITLPMAAKYTNADSDTISSVQGRYFLPLIPILCMGLRTRHIKADESFYKKVLFGTGYVSFVYFGFCILKLFAAI